ncbi:replication initiation protein [Clostridium thermobutyricum]|uniref:replication initiation protein n=1 Tax=Clostridium thermobutyricum TaxID=29372 RepID=UPI0018ABCEB0|nr:replication initiation protein [Clostridium thermobutyricum]
MEKIDKKNEILTDNGNKNYESIVKSNNLIRGSYTVTANEQKFLYKVFEYVQENDYKSNVIVFEFNNIIKEFREVINKNLTKKQFWNMLKKLQKKHPDIIIDGKYVSTQWYRLIGELDYSVITLQLDEFIFKYVQSQKKNFGKLLKSSVFNFNTFYAMKIYEFLRSWANLKKEEYITLDRFKLEMDIHEKKSYSQIYNIKRRILDPSIEEINEKSELKVSYEYVKEGKHIIGLLFKILDNKEKIKNNEEWINVIKNGEGYKLSIRQLQELADNKMITDSDLKIEIFELLTSKLKEEKDKEYEKETKDAIDINFEEINEEKSYKPSLKDRYFNKEELSREELEILVKDKSLKKNDKNDIEAKLEKLVEEDILNFLADKRKVNKPSNKKKKRVTMSEKYKYVGNQYDSCFANDMYDKFTNYCFDKKISFSEDEVMRRILNECIELTLIKTSSDKIQESCYMYFIRAFGAMSKERYKRYKADAEFKIRKEFYHSKEDDSEEVMRDIARDFY